MHYLNFCSPKVCFIFALKAQKYSEKLLQSRKKDFMLRTEIYKKTNSWESSIINCPFHAWYFKKKWREVIINTVQVISYTCRTPPSVIRIFSAWSSMSASWNIRVPPKNHTILKYITRKIHIKIYLLNYTLKTLISYSDLLLLSMLLHFGSLAIWSKIKPQTRSFSLDHLLF